MCTDTPTLPIGWFLNLVFPSACVWRSETKQHEFSSRCVYVLCAPLYLCHKIRLIIIKKSTTGGKSDRANLSLSAQLQWKQSWQVITGQGLQGQEADCWTGALSTRRGCAYQLVSRLDQHISTPGSLIACISFTGHTVVPTIVTQCAPAIVQCSSPSFLKNYY